MNPFLKLKTIISVAIMALFFAPIAIAQDAGTLDQRGSNVYNAALDARDNGNYEGACRGFNNAAVIFENGVYATMRHSMRTEEDRQMVKNYADELQSKANGAKAKAREVCGRPNAVRPVAPSPAPSPPTPPPPQPSSDAEARTVLMGVREANSGAQSFNSATELFKQEKTLEGCAAIRTARHFYVAALSRFGSMPLKIEDTNNSIKSMDWYVETKNCPPQKPAIASNHAALENYSRGSIAFTEGVTAQEANNLVASCGKFKTAKDLFEKAKAANQSSRTETGNEELNTDRINEYENVFTINIGKSDNLAKQDCPKEVVAAPTPAPVPPHAVISPKAVAPASTPAARPAATARPAQNRATPAPKKAKKR